VHLSKLLFQTKEEGSWILKGTKQEGDQGHPHRSQAWNIPEDLMVSSNRVLLWAKENSLVLLNKHQG